MSVTVKGSFQVPAIEANYDCNAAALRFERFGDRSRARKSEVLRLATAFLIEAGYATLWRARLRFGEGAAFYAF
jgi:hypothetical protein